MRIAVFGRHPVPQPGFNGVMSLYEAIWFGRFGHEVELLLPFEDRGEAAVFLERHGLASFDDLDRFGGGFAIRPVFADQADFGRFDVLVYQSYAADDWRRFAAACRRSATLLTKNFPKFVSGPAFANDPSVTNQFGAWDLIACGLRDDVRELQSNAAFFAAHRHQIAYVGRGADDLLLHPARKVGGRPVLGLDVPVGQDFRAVEHWVQAIALLRAAGLDVAVLTLGRDVPGLDAETVPFARFDEVYDRFFNRIWLYLPINYAHSPAHTTAPVQRSHPHGWSARAVYEVQNVEAQMSGAAVVGHATNLIPELYDPGSSGFLFPDFADPLDIAERLERLIAEYPLIRRGARAWAMANARWSDCIRRWERALVARLNRELPVIDDQPPR